MKKKILIIISIVIALFALVCGIKLYRNTIKPIVTWHGYIGSWPDYYELKVQIYENGKCKLIGNGKNGIGQTEVVSYKVEKSKLEELQQKIDELKFKDISENITIWAIDYPSSSITVNYKDKQSHTVSESTGTSKKRRRMGV